MKRFTLIDLAIVLAVFSVFAPAGHAKGSSHRHFGEQQASGMVSWSSAQRVVSWGSERHWQSADGQILVCPWEAKAGHHKECRDKKNDKIDRWIPLTSYAVTGFEIVGFQYFYSGSYGMPQLVVYYGAPKAPPVSAAPVVPVLNFTGPITIKADRVVVQRKR